MKKFSYGLGTVLLAVIVAVSVWFLKPEKTVDYRGIVKSVEYNQDDNCTYIDTYMLYDESSSVIIKVKPRTEIKYIDGAECELKDIKAGDMLDIDYKGKIDGYGSTVTAKWLKVCPRDNVSYSDNE